MPKVSVCVPVFNVEKFIEPCARSIFEQSLDDLEFIFVNDCSTDNAFSRLREVAADYPHLQDRIHLIEHGSNQGPGAARNTAAQQATGDYIYFPDADDYLAPNMLEKMYCEAITSNSDIILCNIDIINNGKTILSENNDFLPTDNDWLRALLRHAPQALWWRLIKREIWQQASLNTDLRGIVRFEDLLMTIKCHYYASKVSRVKDVLYHKNANEGSVTHTHSRAAVDSAIKIGSMIENFLRSEGTYKRYATDIDRFRYIALIPFIATTDYWNPTEWRMLLKQTVHAAHRIRYIGGLAFTLQIAVTHFLLVKQQDKMAFYVMKTMQWIKKLCQIK